MGKLLIGIMSAFLALGAFAECKCGEGCKCAGDVAEITAKLEAAEVELDKARKEIERLEAMAAALREGWLAKTHKFNAKAKERQAEIRARRAEKNAQAAVKQGETLTGIKAVRENARKRGNKGVR